MTEIKQIGKPERIAAVIYESEKIFDITESIFKYHLSKILKKEREEKSPLELLNGQKHLDFYDIVLENNFSKMPEIHGSGSLFFGERNLMLT